EKVKIGQKGDNKNKDNCGILEKIVKVNKKFAKASIRLNYVSGIEIDIDSVKIVQEFYVKHELVSNVVLGMSWIVKTRCDFKWKDRKYCCMIQSNNDETMFVILEEFEIYKNIVDKDYRIKENDDEKKVILQILGVY
ncbi:35892_t:CDS:2, partial [Racocetra persica]